METPEVRYARSGGWRIAYEVFGTGPVDLVYGRTAISQLELVWEEPSVADYFRQLATAARVILWDKRGVGLSDRDVGTPTFEDRMDDLRAVMDAAGSERAVIFGATDTAAMALLFAATYPERTVGLMLIEPIVRGSWAPDFPFAPRREEVEDAIRQSDEDWGSPSHIDRLIQLFAPSRRADPEFHRWFGRVIRFGSSPSAAAALARMNLSIDVRSALPAVHVPTVVLKCPGDRAVREESSDFVAQHVAGAQLVSVPGQDHFFWANPEARAASLRAQIGFLAGLPTRVPDEDRVLKSVVFADIVGSTRLASRLGDDVWRKLLNSFFTVSRAETVKFHGHLVKTTGDGFLATFDGPTRAVKFAQSVRDHAREQGLERLREPAGSAPQFLLRQDAHGLRLKPQLAIDREHREVPAVVAGPDVPIAVGPSVGDDPPLEFGRHSLPANLAASAGERLLERFGRSVGPPDRGETHERSAPPCQEEAVPEEARSVKVPLDELLEGDRSVGAEAGLILRDRDGDGVHLLEQSRVLEILLRQVGERESFSAQLGGAIRQLRCAAQIQAGPPGSRAFQEPLVS